MKTSTKIAMLSGVSCAAMGPIGLVLLVPALYGCHILRKKEIREEQMYIDALPTVLKYAKYYNQLLGTKLFKEE